MFMGPLGANSSRGWYHGWGFYWATRLEAYTCPSVLSTSRVLEILGVHESRCNFSIRVSATLLNVISCHTIVTYLQHSALGRHHGFSHCRFASQHCCDFPALCIAASSHFPDALITTSSHVYRALCCNVIMCSHIVIASPHCCKFPMLSVAASSSVASIPCRNIIMFSQRLFVEWS